MPVLGREPGSGMSILYYCSVLEIDMGMGVLQKKNPKEECELDRRLGP
jgi:hypothetical protein